MLAEQKSASGLWPQKPEIPKVGRAAFVRLYRYSLVVWYDESFKGNPSQCSGGQWTSLHFYGHTICIKVGGWLRESWINNG